MHAKLPSIRTVSMCSKVFGATVGNFLEYYDFIIFGVFSATIARNFFPSQDPATGLLLTFATFGVAAFTRPLGAIVLGLYADRRGRKASLIVTVLLMAGSTTFIGLLPNYEAIGIAAPVLLVCARLVQGFSAGGEFGGATAFLTEHAPPKWRGYYGGWLQSGTFGSVILANVFGIMVFRQDPAIAEIWAWRLPFLFGAILAPLGFFIRRSLPETPVFEGKRAGSDQVAFLAPLLRTDFPKLLQMIGAVVPATIGSYLFLLYLPHFARDELGIPVENALIGGIVAGLSTAIFSPVAGAISDRIGRRRFLMGSMIFSLVAILPIFELLISNTSILKFYAAEAILAVMLALFAGPITAFGAELFSTGRRSTGLSVGFGLSTATFGNFTPFLLTWWVETTHNLQIPAFYMIAALILGLAAIFTSRDSTGLSLSNIGRGGANVD